jgi:hypothetical protein
MQIMLTNGQQCHTVHQVANPPFLFKEFSIRGSELDLTWRDLPAAACLLVRTSRTIGRYLQVKRKEVNLFRMS